MAPDRSGNVVDRLWIPEIHQEDRMIKVVIDGVEFPVVKKYGKLFGINYPELQRKLKNKKEKKVKKHAKRN